MKSVAQNLLLVFLSSVFCFLLLEVGLRLWQQRKGTPFLLSSSEYQDQTLGWKGREVHIPSSPGGKKILILGDSFTDGLGVPDEKLYYSLLAKKLDAEVLAYGGKGFGNLQEYLALKALLPKFHPDLIVLQLCVNDFLNNSWELESRSYLQNALLPRPYLQDDGSIELLFPRSYPHMRVLLDKHSRIFHTLFTRMELKAYEEAKREKGKSIEDRIVRSKGKIPEFERAVEITSRIFDLILQETKGIPLVAFEADEIPPYHASFAKIATEHQLPLFPQVAGDMMDAEKKKIKVRLEDNVHWNEAGHRIAADALEGQLAPILRKETPLKNSSDDPLSGREKE